ncbi:GTP 3',8-cyclase MoaA [Zoogloea sp.]|uniref:GTP 3',8-cyclase MoaA n=1 Tax=Zoogloea sp. TaxID=49181 RepID=UPI0035AF081E
MTQRVIPLADERQLRQLPTIPADLNAATGTLLDSRGRPVRDLRISVTDRCNFRCVYCMPKSVFDKDYAFLPRQSLLSFEEITRLARLFAAHGVTKIRLTGGEPLLRRNLEQLVGQLGTIPQMEVTLTTNGVLLPKKAGALKAAGLRRVTVSLDSLDDTIFRAMNDMDVPVADVLKGIAAAEAAGLGPIKINMVVKRGLNDQEILPMVERFRGTGHILRFIEFMDVGNSNGWRMDDVVPSAEVVRRIHEKHTLEPIDPNYSGEVAERWRFADGSGEIGVISSVTQAFCSTCTRARLSTEGSLYTCLFAQSGHDLRSLMREGRSDAEISAAIGLIWRQRIDRYSEIRTAETAALRKIEMSYIGG